MQNNENNEDNINEIENDNELNERSDELLDSLFSDEPLTKKDEEVEEDNTVEEEESSDETDESTEEDESDDEEEDWDASHSKKSDNDDNDVEEFKNDSAAVKQAKIKGREAKELKAKLTERELELERLQTEREELQARLNEFEATKIKPEDHPEYTSIRDEILTDVSEASDLLSVPDPSSLVKNFGQFMADYLRMSSLSGDDRVEARTQLKAAIVDELNLSDIKYKELDSDERQLHEGTITDVLKIIQRNASKAKELHKLHNTITERAKTGLLSIGVREYENTLKEFTPALDGIGTLAEDVIEANPHAIESVVSKLVRESPEAAKRLEKAKRDVLEAIVGPRALTQTEIDKLEAAGENVKEFIAERAKAHRSKQIKLAAMFVQGLMTRSTLKETLVELNKLKQDSEAEESELDVLRKTTKKSGTTKPKEVRPKDRVSPLTSILGIDDED